MLCWKWLWYLLSILWVFIIFRKELCGDVNSVEKIWFCICFSYVMSFGRFRGIGFKFLFFLK